MKVDEYDLLLILITLLITLIIIICCIITLSILQTYAKTFLVTENTLVECDDNNRTQCVIISKSEEAIELFPKKSFSVEEPSTNTA